MYDPMIFIDEIFKDIQVYNIAPYYQISNYGKVINKNTGNQMSLTIDGWGYLRVALYTNDGIQKSFSVHRLVMMAFHPIENPHLYEVNHMCGIKIDNHDTELEWVTHSENMIHAYRTGLNNNIREDAANSVMTNEEIRYICECLEKGIPFIDIANSLKGSSSLNVFDVVRNVYSKKAWKSISKDYTFHDYGDNKHSLSESEVHRICQLMQEGYKNSEIVSMIGYGNDYHDPDTVNMRNLVSSIRKGTCYREISNNYSFKPSRATKSKAFTEGQVHLICKCLEKNIKSDDILIKLGLYDSSEKESLKKTISSIKHRNSYKDISSQYNF